MNKEKKEKNWGKTLVYTMFYLCFFAIGIITGMMLQQTITQSTLMKVAGNLDGVHIDIDLNKTEIIDGITDFYTPYFEEMLNESHSDILEVEDE